MPDALIASWFVDDKFENWLKKSYYGDNSYQDMADQQRHFQMLVANGSGKQKQQDARAIREAYPEYPTTPTSI